MSASTRSRNAVSSRCAAACWTSFPRPRNAPCGWTCSTWRSSRCAGSRRSPSARWARRSEVEIAPAAELAVEHRELAEIAAATGAFDADEDQAERPDIAELLPLERFGALLELVGPGTEVLVAAEEELAPALADHWTDVGAAFGDRDADQLYVSPEGVQATLAQRTRVWLSALAAGQPIELRAQSPDTAARSLAEAEPELEKLVRSGLSHGRRLSTPRRGRARGLQPRSPESHLAGGERRRRRPGDRALAALHGGLAARGLHRPAAEARGVPRAPAAAPPPSQSAPTARRRAVAGGSGAARGASLLQRSANGRHRRARGPRRGALRGL